MSKITGFEYWGQRAITILKVLLLIVMIAGVATGSLYLARTSITALPRISSPVDLAATLFAAAALFITIIAMLMTAVPVIGWKFLGTNIREWIKEETKTRMDRIEKEVHGRSLAIAGYTLGEKSIGKDFIVIDEEQLREAISYCEDAYRILKGTSLPVEFMALNNFLTYHCSLRDKSKRLSILDEARRMYTEALRHDSHNLILTYIKTVLIFSDESREITEACSRFEEVRVRDGLSTKQRREVEIISALCDKHAAAMKAA